MCTAPAQVGLPLGWFLQNRSFDQPAEVLSRVRAISCLAALQLRLQVQGAEEARIHLRHLCTQWTHRHTLVHVSKRAQTSAIMLGLQTQSASYLSVGQHTCQVFFVCVCVCVRSCVCVGLGELYAVCRVRKGVLKTSTRCSVPEAQNDARRGGWRVRYLLKSSR